jgi:adhesin transport system outer membrane protein
MFSSLLDSIGEGTIVSKPGLQPLGPRLRLFRTLLVASLAVFAGTPYAGAMSLREAVERTVHSNPAVDAARANRRATDHELRQAQGRALPQVTLDGEFGAEKIDRPQGLAPAVNDTWRNRRQASVTVRQFLFDGWDRANDVYKQAARVDAAALRVLARSEALALDAVEAYIDVLRHLKVLDISRRNVARHREILRIVRDLVRGGRVTRSEVLQVEERLAGAEAAVERVQQSLLEARAKFRRVVGAEAANLSAVSDPKGVPVTRQQAVDMGLADHPLLGAAEADADTAKSAMDQTRSGFFPQISLEAKGLTGADIGGTPGKNEELLGRVVLTWNLFDGRITHNKNREFAERWAQAMSERDDRARQIAEEIERALAARTTGVARLEALRRQSDRSREVARAYEEEYKAAKRSLLDLLDSESARFNNEIQAVSQEHIQLFAGYRVLGAMGRLLRAMQVAAPAEGGVGRRHEVRERGPFRLHLEPLRQ